MVKKNTVINNSFIWNGIIIGWGICNKGITWMPHKSSTLSVWHSRWIPELTSLRDRPLTLQDESLTIKDILNNNNWDFSKISMSLEPTIINKIKATQISNNLYDFPLWALSSNGFFNSKSCYRLLEEQPICHKDFTWIWDTKCPNKIKYLLRKKIHNKLPTRNFLNQKLLNMFS